MKTGLYLLIIIALILVPAGEAFAGRTEFVIYISVGIVIGGLSIFFSFRGIITEADGEALPPAFAHNTETYPARDEGSASSVIVPIQLFSW